MSEACGKPMKRIFYFNITYSCNSRCVYCYSHNTRHAAAPYREIPLEQFAAYLESKKLSPRDRVIVNGGEPLLHSAFQSLLWWLLPYGCEVLVYTNGRLLPGVDLSRLNERYRFVVPIHGYPALHDAITRVPGSFSETAAGMAHFRQGTNCLLDLKVILNQGMTESEATFARTLDALDTLYFNHAVHLTAMADTPVSERNGCSAVDNRTASRYLALLYRHFPAQGRKIKIFDVCVRDTAPLLPGIPEPLTEELCVYFKDCEQERQIVLQMPPLPCRDGCPAQPYCISAVGDYKALTVDGEKIYEGLE